MDAWVIDIGHHNSVMDLKPAGGVGHLGALSTSPQSKAYADPDYAKHREMAASASCSGVPTTFNTGDAVHPRCAG
jgi:hypothetical protein